MCCRVLGASLVRNWDWVEIMRGVGGEGGRSRVCTFSVVYRGKENSGFDVKKINYINYKMK